MTVNGVDGNGAIIDFAIAGTLPPPPWPSNNINDGGNDEYDNGNYIDTDLEQQISYNSGNVVVGSSAFGGGDYVVTYQHSIFGVFAVGAQINSIGTSGNSGFDSYGQSDSGALYNDSGSTANAPITWTSPNNHVWRIEQYNGGAAVTYNGGDLDAPWFDPADSTSGNNDFRGAIIEYHAFVQNRGTIIGTIHISLDYSDRGTVTHTEHYSGNASLAEYEFWYTDGNGRLYFRHIPGQSQSALVQFTSRIFYGSEFYC